MRPNRAVAVSALRRSAPSPRAGRSGSRRPSSTATSCRSRRLHPTTTGSSPPVSPAPPRCSWPNLHKLGERQSGLSDRLLDKDAHDAYPAAGGDPNGEPRHHAQATSHPPAGRSGHRTGGDLPARDVRGGTAGTGLDHGRPRRTRCGRPRNGCSRGLFPGHRPVDGNQQLAGAAGQPALSASPSRTCTMSPTESGFEVPERVPFSTGLPARKRRF